MSISLHILDETTAQLREATAAKKCWRCGCLHQSLSAIEQAIPDESRPPKLEQAIREARSRLVPIQYDCLGCEVCYPAIAINSLARSGHAVEVEICPTGQAEAREGWPPLPGAFKVLRYAAPVAVCTLTDEALKTRLSTESSPQISLVGTLQTENLGIERLILNVLANPNIRFVVLCGADSRQQIGHLPGRSMMALAQSGVDDRMRIIGAEGRRPVLRNIGRETVEHFRRTVELVDLIGVAEMIPLVRAVQACAERDPGPAEAFAATPVVEPMAGYLPERMVSDPAGYFVVYVNRRGGLLSLEHYANEGVLDMRIEGKAAPELYTAAIDKGLLSRLDHAAYLGRELARAEIALKTGDEFIQDAAAEQRLPPERLCSCGPISEGSTGCDDGR